MSKKSSGDQKGSSNRPNFSPLIGIITRFSGNSRRIFLLAALMLVLEAGSATFIPQVIAYAIKSVESFFGQGPEALSSGIGSILQTLILVMVGMIGLTMINSLCDSLAEIYLAQGGRQVGYNVRVFLYNHLQKLSLSFHTQSRTGDILTKVTSDVAAVENFILGNLSDFVGSVLLLIFFLWAIIRRSWVVWTKTGELGVFILPLIAILVIPLMALITSYFTGRIKSASKRLRSSEGELASAAQEMLASIRVVQVYGQGSYEQSLFSGQSKKAMNAALEAAAYQARFSWVVSVLGAVAQAAVIGVSIWLIFRVGNLAIMGIAELGLFLKYIDDMFKPTKKLISEWNALGKLSASLDSIGELKIGRAHV